MGRRRGTSAFPVARIKKMMQSDDDVGKIATVTPVLVAKALELMMEYVLKEAAQVAHDRHTKTVTPQHLKTCVMSNDSFDFLRDVLKHVQPLLDDKPRRKPRGKRPRSPVQDSRRVRRARDDALVSSHRTAHDNPVEHLPSRRDVHHTDLVPSQVAVPVETTKHDDEDDDYDDDDDNAGDNANTTQTEHTEHTEQPAQPAQPNNDDAVPIPVESQNAPGRMSVSALLS